MFLAWESGFIKSEIFYVFQEVVRSKSLCLPKGSWVKEKIGH